MGAPAWSPDGTALAFAGADGLYVVTVTPARSAGGAEPLPGTVSGP